MKRLFLAVLLVIAAPSFAADVPPSFADLVAKLTPAVVNVATTQKIKGAPGMQLFEGPEGEDMPEEFRKFFQQMMPPQKGGKQKEVEREVYSLGSGFIVDEDGYIVTNNHVISDAEEITVTLSDDTQLKAKIVGRDTKTDLALLKVNAGKKLPAVTLGDSEASRVGDWVIAIGNPYGLGGSVTAGIISARARNINAGPFDDFIQTDAAINRGNSGGPLFNMKGEVIGINTAIFSPSGGSIGIGFAVPTLIAAPVIKQLKATGHIDRGWLGVKIQDVTDDIANSLGLPKTEGALVMDVTKDSPAGKAGLESGDVILKFDGKDIKEMHNLPLIVADTSIGKTVDVTLWHRSSTKVVQVTVGKLKDEEIAQSAGKEEAPHAAGTAKSREVLGLSLVPLNDELRHKYGLEADAKGVAVVRVKPDSEASRHGFEEGDVITQAADTPVTSVKDVLSALESTRKTGRKFLLLRVIHGGEMVFVTLPVEEKKD